MAIKCAGCFVDLGADHHQWCPELPVAVRVLDEDGKPSSAPCPRKGVKFVLPVLLVALCLIANPAQAQMDFPVPLTAKLPPESIIVRMTQAATCVEINTEKKPVSFEQREGKELGDFIELRNTVNGRIAEQKTLIFDGRRWWEITGIPECKKE